MLTSAAAGSAASSSYPSSSSSSASSPSSSSSSARPEEETTAITQPDILNTLATPAVATTHVRPNAAPSLYSALEPQPTTTHHTPDSPRPSEACDEPGTAEGQAVPGQTKRKGPSQDSGLEQRRRQEHHTGYDRSGRDDTQDTTDQMMYGSFAITSRTPAAGPSGTRIELQLHMTYARSNCHRHGHDPARARRSHGAPRTH